VTTHAPSAGLKNTGSSIRARAVIAYGSAMCSGLYGA
jgi:hypothetical protein